MVRILSLSQRKIFQWGYNGPMQMNEISLQNKVVNGLVTGADPGFS